MGKVFRHLVRDETGQDLVEYALLIGLVAIAGAAALNRLQAVLHDVYVSWDTGNQALWQMPPPSGP
jgi:Flp pilus assembly pilin Flp